jgi:transposase
LNYLKYIIQKKRVSKILNITRSTIIKWINKYYNKPTNLIKLINTTFKPIQTKINVKNKIKNHIVELYTLNPFYTRKQIQNLIFTNYKYKIGVGVY